MAFLRFTIFSQLQERLAQRREERAKRKAQEELDRNAEENKKQKENEIEQDENSPPKAASAGHVVERTEKLKGRASTLPVSFCADCHRSLCVSAILESYTARNIFFRLVVLQSSQPQDAFASLAPVWGPDVCCKFSTGFMQVDCQDFYPQAYPETLLPVVII